MSEGWSSPCVLVVRPSPLVATHTFCSRLPQLLNKTISPYVDNLNPDDLNLAVMAGDLTLHNLHLKRSAVDKYNLPVEVVEGASFTYLSTK